MENPFQRHGGENQLRAESAMSASTIPSSAPDACFSPGSPGCSLIFPECLIHHLQEHKKTDVQNNCRSTALPESILQYLLTIAEKQFMETFPFLTSKIFPYITSTRVYYYSLLGLSKAELQHKANFPGVLKFCHGFPIQRKGHVSLHFYSSDYRLHSTKSFGMILCVSHNSCY